MQDSKWQRPLVVSVILAVALYALTAFVADADRVIRALLSIDPAAWAAILGLSVVNYALRYWRWDLYIRSLSAIRVTHGKHFSYYLAGFALSTTPGKAGEAIRSWYLHRHGVRVRHSVGALFVERLLDLFAIAILSVLGVWAFQDYRWFIGLVLVGIIIAVIMLQRRQWLYRLQAVVGARERLARAVAHVSSMLEDCAGLLRGRWLASGLMIGLLSWGGEGIGFWLILKAMGQSVDMTTAVSVYGIAVLVGALSFLPGGLGGTEAVMTLLLMALGVDNAVAVAATLACRVATLWFAVIIGLVSMSLLSLLQESRPPNSTHQPGK